MRHEIPPSKNKSLATLTVFTSKASSELSVEVIPVVQIVVRAVCTDRRALITTAHLAALLGMRLYIAGIRYFRTEQTLMLQTSLDQLFDLLSLWSSFV